MSPFVVLPMILGIVFVAAGVLKLGRPDAVITALDAFGLPGFLRTPLIARSLPVAEIALGAALLVTRGSLFVVAALIATVVMAGFVAVTARAFHRGERFDCGCFGAMRSPISGPLVLRNVVLLGIAISAVLLGRSGFGGAIPTITAATPNDAAWLVVAVLMSLLCALFVWGAHARGEDDGSGVALAGTSLPDLYLMTAREEPVRLRDTLAGRPHLIVAVRPGCHGCETLLAASDLLAAHLDGRAGLLLVVAGDPEEFAEEHPELVDAALFGAWSLTSHLRMSVYPAAALIDAAGTVRAEPVAGVDRIFELAQRAGSLDARA